VRSFLRALKGGRVYDGTGGSRCRADVGVWGNTIAEVGPRDVSLMREERRTSAHLSSQGRRQGLDRQVEELLERL
jgi:hypothetical protein